MEHMVKKVTGSGSRESYRFSESQKKKIVSEIESGELTAEEAKAKYGISSPKTLKTWVVRFASNPDLDIRRKQQYPPSHRCRIALELASGSLTPQQAARENKVGLTTIRLWMKEFKTATPTNTKKSPKGLSGKDSTIQDAASQINHLQLKVIALETMIDIAEKQFDIDIRKKSGTKQ